MKKIMLSTLVLSTISSVLLADSTLNQRSTRLDSMVLNNYMTKDGFNIFFNPANLGGAKTGAFLELGLKPNGGADTINNASGSTSIDGMAGVLLNAGVVGNFAVVLNRNNNTVNDLGMSTGTKQNNFDFLYGYEFSSDLKIGARLTYASLSDAYSNTYDDKRVLINQNTYNSDVSREASASKDATATDLTLELGAQAFGFDGTLTYGSLDYADTRTGTRDPLYSPHYKETTYTGVALTDTVENITTSNYNSNAESDGASLLELALAYTFKLNKDDYVIAYGMYNSTDTSRKGSESLNVNSSDYNTTGSNIEGNTTAESFATEDSTKFDTVLLGAAYNMKPTENILLVVSGEYTNRIVTTKVSSTRTQHTEVNKIFNVTPNTSHTTYDRPVGVVSNVETTDTINDFSVVVAAEANVTKSLTLRFGLRESIYYSVDSDSNDNTNGVAYTNNDAVTTGTDTSTDTSNTVNDETKTYSTSSNVQNPMVIAIGFGYQVIDSVSVDGLINAELFLKGPNFVSGETIDNINARLAVNYNF